MELFGVVARFAMCPGTEVSRSKRLRCDVLRSETLSNPPASDRPVRPELP
jgi:hypothetical protein